MHPHEYFRKLDGCSKPISKIGKENSFSKLTEKIKIDEETDRTTKVIQVLHIKTGKDFQRFIISEIHF